MPVRIVPSNRDDRISWLDPLEPFSIKRASRAMMGNLEELNRRRRRVSAHPRQCFRFDVGRKEHVMRTTGQRRDDRAVVQHMTPALATRPLVMLHDLRWVQDGEPAG